MTPLLLHLLFVHCIWFVDVGCGPFLSIATCEAARCTGDSQVFKIYSCFVCTMKKNFWSWDKYGCRVGAAQHLNLWTSEHGTRKVQGCQEAWNLGVSTELLNIKTRGVWNSKDPTGHNFLMPYISCPLVKISLLLPSSFSLYNFLFINLWPTLRNCSTPCFIHISCFHLTCVSCTVLQKL